MTRDTSKWEPVAGDHADDISYARIASPGPATDEQRTAVEADADEAAPDETIDATIGALAAADELGVDLATVTGTGAEGRITKADVEAAANG